MLGLLAAPVALALPAPAGRVPAVRWRGSALGAEAMLRLEQVDEARARRLISQVLAEIDRLENIFSLHRATSSLSRLNRHGRLTAPPHELVDLLNQAGRVHRLSAGAFDPSIQPLWRLHAIHFARTPQRHGPSPSAVERARERVGFERVLVDPAEIRFMTPGMALTLNGIAQGAITDRIADLLRNEGLGHVLIDLGEIRAIGGHASGAPWSVDLARPARGDRTLQRVALRDMAVASSDPTGAVFDRGGRHHHLIDPRTGWSSVHARPVTVVAPRATLADALSTALALTAPRDAHALSRASGSNVSIVEQPS